MIAYRGVDELYWFEIIERSSSVKVGEPTLKQDYSFDGDSLDGAVFALFIQIYC